MLLVVDVGNTQTHLGIFDGDRLVDHWRVATLRDSTGDELALTVAGLLGLRGMGFGDLRAGIVSTTVPRLAREWSEVARRHLGRPMPVVGPRMRTGMPIRTESPHELGADRLVNAVAAHARLGGPCVVVDFGTAITFDAVSAAGEYLGGIIAPGIEISMEALTERAAKLPRIELVEPRALIGRSTAEAMRSGVLYGFAGMVDGIVGRLRAELGGDTQAIATGGLAPVVVPYTDTIDETDDLLTLTGLRLIEERNR